MALPIVNVLQGTHVLQTDVQLQHDSMVSVASGSILIFDNLLDLNGHTLTKTGEGELTIRNLLALFGTGTVNLMDGVVQSGGRIGGSVNNVGATLAPIGDNGFSVMPEPSTFTLLLGGIILLICRHFTTTDKAGTDKRAGGPKLPHQFLTFVIVIATGPLGQLSAQVHRWNVDGLGDWNVNSNWDSGQIPIGDGETAVFGNSITSSATVVTDDPVTVSRIEFDNGNKYALAGTRKITLGAAPSIEVVQGTHEFQVGVRLMSNAVVTVASSSLLVFDGSLELNGHSLTKTGTGTLQVNNLFRAIGAVNGRVHVLEGILNGGGAIDGHLQNDGSTVAPGAGIGFMRVFGDYVQTAGTLATEIAGTRTHDRLLVDGDATLSGTLKLDTRPGFTPAVGPDFGIFGDSFIVITAASVTAEFHEVVGRHVAQGLFYAVQYNATNVTLRTFQAAPGDADGDRDVDMSDFDLLKLNFDARGISQHDWTEADFDIDGDVDITDFNLLASNFAPTGYGSAVGIPEPSARLLLIVGGALMFSLVTAIRSSHLDAKARTKECVAGG